MTKLEEIVNSGVGRCVMSYLASMPGKYTEAERNCFFCGMCRRIEVIFGEGIFAAYNIKDNCVEISYSRSARHPSIIIYSDCITLLDEYIVRRLGGAGGAVPHVGHRAARKAPAKKAETQQEEAKADE